MHRITRQILRPFLFGLIPLVLVACGSDDTSTTNSSAVYASHSVVLVQSTTKSWGANGYGQLGIGTTTDSPNPVSVTGNFSAVRIGGAHSIALDTAGNVWGWGRNASGQLGDGTVASKTSPAQVLLSAGGSALTGVKAITAGGNHSLAIAADDTVRAWGLNSSGQLGDGSVVTTSSPVQVSALSGVTAIAAGAAFSLALKDGNVWAWGSNTNGQLGNNSFVTSPLPVQVVMLNESTLELDDTIAISGITAIAAGGSHALALKDDGTIYAWGYNEFGQLGDGTTTSSSIAVPVVRTGILGDATAIAAGLDHSLAIIGGSVYAWGYNYYGQLGNDAALQSNTPVTSLQIVQNQDGHFLSSVDDIIATGHHCIARDSSNNIWTWGNNTYGQLGDGTSVSRSKAQIVITAPPP